MPRAPSSGTRCSSAPPHPSLWLPPPRGGSRFLNAALLCFPPAPSLLPGQGRRRPPRARSRAQPSPSPSRLRPHGWALHLPAGPPHGPPDVGLPSVSSYLAPALIASSPLSHLRIFSFSHSGFFFFLSAYKFAQSSVIMKCPTDATSSQVPIPCVSSFNPQSLERVIHAH